MYIPEAYLVCSAIVAVSCLICSAIVITSCLIDAFVTAAWTAADKSK